MCLLCFLWLLPVYQLLDHPSDVGILSRGATREEALIEASHGLVSILANPSGFHPLEERYFKAPGRDDAEQIINWLNEILFFFDTEAMIFVEFAIESWDSGEIIGRARGERLDSERHELRTAVKAATYHQFESHPVDGGWELRIFVDV